MTALRLVQRWRPAGAAAAAVLAVTALFGAVPPAGAQTLRAAVPASLEIPDHPRVRYYADRYS